MPVIKRLRPYPRYLDYRKYKPHLRRDFSYTCAFCSIHENDWGGQRHFHVEHFRPRSRFQHLILVYENLLYACDVCNCFKGDDWPSDDPIADGIGYLDPCEYDYALHFAHKGSSGIIVGITPPAKYMVERLHLNRQHLVKLRQKRLREQELYLRFLQHIDQLLDAIDLFLRDETLDCCVTKLLEIIREHLVEERAERTRVWQTRLLPAYDADDLS